MKLLSGKKRVTVTFDTGVLVKHKQALIDLRDLLRNTNVEGRIVSVSRREMKKIPTDLVFRTIEERGVFDESSWDRCQFADELQ